MKIASKGRGGKGPDGPSGPINTSVTGETSKISKNNASVSARPSTGQQRIALSDAQFAYEVQGDAESALDILQSAAGTPTLAENVEADADADAIEIKPAPLSASSSASFDLNHNLALLAYLSFSNDTANGNVVNLDDSAANENVDGDHEQSHGIFQNQLEQMYANEDACTGEETHELTQKDSPAQTRSVDHTGDYTDYDGIVISIRKLILGHNLALNYLITNRPEEGVSILLPLFRTFSQSTNTNTEKEEDSSSQHQLNDNGQNDDDGDENNNNNNNNNNIVESEKQFLLRDVKCKISFLLLDCTLASCKIDILHEVLSWIESFISKTISNKQHIIDESISSSLKFRLHCYKSRTLFLQSKFEEASIREANIRVAKKELKSAMEIYHHKLAKNKGSHHLINHQRGNVKGGGTGDNTTVADEGASVQESVTPSIGSTSITSFQNSDAGNANVTTNGNPPEDRNQLQTKRLHRQNQCALYLKANLEHLKGNTKKSLKLCSEVQHCGVRQRERPQQSHPPQQQHNPVEDFQCSSDIQSAYHFNNLAIIHQAAGKLHLAMHYYSRCLGHVENIEKQQKTKTNKTIVENDGVVNPIIPLPQILFNASICAQQLANFPTAHECMKRCVLASPSTFGMDPFCWLQMGESCINSHVTLKRKSRNRVCRVSSSNNSSSSNGTNHTDMAFCSDSLPRAVDCLNQCIVLCNSNDDDNSGGNIAIRKKKYLESAQVLLAYVWLEQNNPLQVINLAESMFKEAPLIDNSSSDVEKTICCKISLRRRATMRMYVCEAMNMVGITKSTDALNYLSDSKTSNTNHDHDDDSRNSSIVSDLNLLAAHLATIDISKKKQSLNQNEIRRYNHANASVHISSSITNLALGNINTSEEEARSACNILTNDVDMEMKDVKGAAHVSLIQSLICGGKVAEAVQIAKNLK